ncbi:glycosyltransferase family 2 protein [Patescibacteria group bacterium]
MKLSVILPVYNEEESIRILYQQIIDTLYRIDIAYEIIAINDGSNDDSYSILEEISSNDNNFRVINFRRNFGQTAAMAAGIDLSQGEIIIPLDSDLQNDPVDIPHFLEKIDQGFDVISGWRRYRYDKLINRKIPSWIANNLISLITGLKLHDYGCTIKAYRSSIMKDVCFYGEMHRFMPAYAAWHGAKVGEIVVNHRPRQYGKTKYGIMRSFRVVSDLLTVKFLTKYSTKPMHFFGNIAYWTLFFSFLSGILSLFFKFYYGISFILTPLPLLTVFLVLVGLQFILMGLLAEILIRIYYECQSKPIYSIKNKINFF